MTQELTSEEIITRLLVSREIINPKGKLGKEMYASVPKYNLGDYLEDNDFANSDFENEFIFEKNIDNDKFKKSKYSFINLEKNVKF